MTVSNKVDQDTRRTREEMARTLQSLQAQVRNDLGGRVLTAEDVRIAVRKRALPAAPSAGTAAQL